MLSPIFINNQFSFSKFLRGNTEKARYGCHKKLLYLFWSAVKKSNLFYSIFMEKICNSIKTVFYQSD